MAIGHEVGHDLPVVDGEPLAGAPEAAHDLVADQQDAVPGAELAHALQVAVGRDEDAVGADHGLDDEGGDGLRPLVAGSRPRVSAGRPSCSGSASAPAAAVAESGTRTTPGMPGSAAQRRGSPVSVIAPAVRAVVRAVAREDLLAAGDRARDLDGVLVGLGAAVGEEEDVDVARRDLGELRAEPRARLGGHERVRRRRSVVRLRLDGARSRAGRRGRC